MKRGFLIVIEGIDGAGKTTHARKLVRWLRKKGIQTRYTFEPTRGAIGRILEKMASKRKLTSELRHYFSQPIESITLTRSLDRSLKKDS